VTDDRCLVHTSSGRVRGAAREGVFTFRGLPYADTTAGVFRFQAPRPMAWSGVRDTLAPGPRCPQPDPPTTAPHVAFALDPSPCAEDCLTLNIDTPSLDENARRPVMVFLHGGGFKVWGSGAPVLDGANLARRGVVVVSVNHRLNLFGFLHLPAPHGVANAGLLDCVAALHWLRDNVARFGGDPDNITLFGQSGGGSKVAMLMAMPRARGLFHKAIIQSASSLLVPATLEDAERNTHHFLARLGLRPGPEGFTALRALPADTLLQALPQAIRDAGLVDNYRPVVDGQVLPMRPFDADAVRLNADVPLMTGWCENEQRWAFASAPGVYERSAAQVRAATARMMDLQEADVDPLLQAYRRSRPDERPGDLYAQIVGDHRYRRNITQAADAQSQQDSAPVYRYLLSWRSPAMDGLLRAPHTLCLPFVFANVDRSTGITGDGPDRYALQEQMAGAWVAFAQRGDPNHGALPSWPRYAPQRRATMVFDRTSRAVDDPFASERIAFDPYPSYIPAFAEAGRPL
jgi:para-nitrobenzyl esterase